jgi:DNA-binding NtrC family response regulator
VTRILVITPDTNAERTIRSAWDDVETFAAATLEEAGPIIERRPIEFVFIDIEELRPLLAVGLGGDFLSEFHALVPGARAIVMSSPDAIREAVNLVHEGASDYLTYPLVRDEVELVRRTVERRERLRSELAYLRNRSLDVESLGAVSSRAESMKDVLRKIRQVAPTRSMVLLTGETGTGKCFLAKVVHQHSTRGGRQFVSVHCGAIPDSLLESELFGHERGAFTGAERRKLGKFEIAHGGTIFLDEIATISTAMQVKLLNVLQERSIQRIGGDRDVEVDVRILAATNMDLDRLTREGTFRSDLFYRLNVFPIEVPALRDRREDIPGFVEGFLDRLRRYHQKDIRGVDDQVMDAFSSYHWPGNVRELENLLERAYILETSETLTSRGFPPELFGRRPEEEFGLPADGETLAEVRNRAASSAERRYLEHQLDAHGGRIDATAKAAGVTVRQLNTLMRKHGFRKEAFRPSSGGRDRESTGDGESS